MYRITAVSACIPCYLLTTPFGYDKKHADLDRKLFCYIHATSNVAFCSCWVFLIYSFCASGTLCVLSPSSNSIKSLGQKPSKIWEGRMNSPVFLPALFSEKTDHIYWVRWSIRSLVSTLIKCRTYDSSQLLVGNPFKNFREYGWWTWLMCTLSS